MDDDARDLVERLVAQQTIMLDLVGRLNGLLGQPPADRQHNPTAPARSTTRVAVSLLGSFQLRVGARLVDTWRQTKALALLQYLLAHHGRPTPREVLIEALWPDPDALAAGSSLKVAVHSLRQLLADLGGEDAELTVQAQAAGYQLCAPDLWLDTEEFEHACRAGRLLEAQGLHQQAIERYTSAVSLYRGDFLESAATEWAALRRESLKDQYLFMLGRLADSAIRAKDYDSCILRCQQLLQHDPCREDAYRVLMAAHSRLGQRARVQRWYEVCRQTLASQLDAQPEPETEQVYRQALKRTSAGQPRALFTELLPGAFERRTA